MASQDILLFTPVSIVCLEQFRADHLHPDSVAAVDVLEYFAIRHCKILLYLVHKWLLPNLLPRQGQMAPLLR